MRDTKAFHRELAHHLITYPSIALSLSELYPQERRGIMKKVADIDMVFETAPYPSEEKILFDSGVYQCLQTAMRERYPSQKKDRLTTCVAYSGGVLEDGTYRLGFKVVWCSPELVGPRSDNTSFLKRARACWLLQNPTSSMSEVIDSRRRACVCWAVTNGITNAGNMKVVPCNGWA